MKEIYEKNINTLISEKYKRVNILPTEIKNQIVEQLYWVQANTQFTPQAAVLYNGDGNWQKYLHREVFRALSRIECMLLLKNSEDYIEFTFDQIENDRLSESAFKSLMQLFKDFSLVQITAHIYASLIASVTLSPEAVKLADEIFGKNQYPVDSILFSGKTVSKAGNMYPVIKTASEEIQKILLACFPDDARHWRHAFFLENKGCLEPLRLQIKSSTNVDALKKEVEEWLNYWLINALGFNGHIKTFTGSEFMTESVFQRAQCLNNSIKKLFDNPELDVLAEYSRQCFALLMLEIGNPKLETMVVRLLNMTNIFNHSAAKELIAYLKANKNVELLKEHAEVFDSKKNATYVPGLLQNVFMKSKNNFELLLKAFWWVIKVIASSKEEITSFRLITETILDNLIMNNFENPIEILANGDVKVKLEEIGAVIPTQVGTFL